MFEALDAARLAQAHDAYGLSDHLLVNLRALATAPLDDATEILDQLANFVFHQDQFYEVTPLVVPFFLELLEHDLPIRTALTKVVGSMLAADRRSDHGVATAAAIEEGRAVIEALLDGEPPALRAAAAWTVSMMPTPRSEPLLRRLATEADDDVRVSLVIALAKRGEKKAIEIAKEGSRAADVARVVLAEAPIDDATAAAFARLLAARPWPLLDVCDGLPSVLAIRHLERLGPAEPRTFELLREAYVIQWNIPFEEEPQLYNTRLVSQTDEEYERAQKGQRANWPIDGIARALREMADRVTAEADRRWLLENIDLYRPRNGIEAQRDFLRGDGVLDEEVTIDGVRAKVADHLLADVTPENGEKLFAAFSTALSPSRLYELGMCILGNHLGYGTEWDALVARWCAADHRRTHHRLSRQSRMQLRPGSIRARSGDCRKPPAATRAGRACGVPARSQ